MLITDGIHLIEGVNGANVFLLTGQKTLLVDTGLPKQEKKIIKYLLKIGLELSDLAGIILTHYDLDHVGSLKALAELAKCPVYAHSLEIPYIMNEKPRPGIKRLLPLATLPLYGPLRAPLEIISIEEGPFFDWEIIHAPGHTPGHIVLYRNGIAVVGDVLQGGKVRLAPSIFTWKDNLLKESVSKLLTRPLRWVLPGHGPATPASNHWLDQLEKELK